MEISSTQKSQVITLPAVDVMIALSNQCGEQCTVVRIMFMRIAKDFDVSVRAATGECPKKLTELLEISGTRISVNPKNTDFGFDIRIVGLGSIIASCGQYRGDFTIRREDLSDRLQVIIPLKGQVKAQVGTQTIEANADFIVLAPSRQLSRLEYSSDCHHMILEIPQSDLRRKLGELHGQTIRENIQFQVTLKSTSEAGRLLSLLSKALFEGLGQDTASAAKSFTHLSLVDAILCCLLEQVWHNYADAAEPAGNIATPKYIERAIEFMQTNLPQQLTIELIAAAVNVSPRTLQQGFKQFRGTTPMAYLKELRMQAAHRELEWAPAGISVADIGRRWGFSHLGRFAAEYRERFGKAPSGTLRGL